MNEIRIFLSDDDYSEIKDFLHSSSDWDDDFACFDLTKRFDDFLSAFHVLIHLHHVKEKTITPPRSG